MISFGSQITKKQLDFQVSVNEDWSIIFKVKYTLSPPLEGEAIKIESKIWLTLTAINN